MIFTIASGTLVAASVMFLVAGCHSSPVPNGFAANAADKSREARLTQVETMPHLQAFDEQFYLPPPEDN